MINVLRKIFKKNYYRKYFRFYSLLQKFLSKIKLVIVNRKAKPNKALNLNVQFYIKNVKTSRIGNKSKHLLSMLSIIISRRLPLIGMK